MSNDSRNLNSSTSWLFHDSTRTIDQNQSKPSYVTDDDDSDRANVTDDLSIGDEPVTVIRKPTALAVSPSPNVAVRLTFNDTTNLSPDSNLPLPIGPSTSSPLQTTEKENLNDLLLAQFSAINLTVDDGEDEINRQRSPVGPSAKRQPITLARSTSRSRLPVDKPKSSKPNVFDDHDETDDSFQLEQFFNKQRAPAKTPAKQEDTDDGMSSFIVADDHESFVSSADESRPNRFDMPTKFKFPPTKRRSILGNMDMKLDPYALSDGSEDDVVVKQPVTSVRNPKRRRPHRKPKVEEDVPPVVFSSSSSSAGESDEDSDDPRLKDSFQLPLSPEPVTTPTAKTTTLKVKRAVFDHDSSDDDDMFVPPPAPTPRPKAKTKPQPIKKLPKSATPSTTVDELATPKADVKTEKVLRTRNVFDMTSSSDEDYSPKLKLPTSFKPIPKTAPVAKLLKTPSAVRERVSSQVDQTFLMALNKTPPGQLPDVNVQQYKGARNFKKHRDSLVQRLLTTFNEYVFDGLIPSNTEILWKSRLAKTAGVCVYRRVNGERVVRIELSEKVCDRPCRVRDTFCHELCHAAVWIQTGDAKSGHGPKFKWWAYRASKIYPQLPVITRCHSYDIRAKFVYRCVGCGQEVRRHSKSLNTARKVCGKCKGRFALYRQTADGGEVHVECPIPPNQKDGKLFNFDAPSNEPPTPTRPPNAFAIFVKEHYGTYKVMGRTHKEVMTKLSEKYKESKQKR